VDNWRQTLTDLVTNRAAALNRQAFLLCGNTVEAEDLVQDALVRAFSRPLRAPAPAAAEAYVRAVMPNRFIDLARRRARWQRVAPRAKPDDTAPDSAASIAVRTDVAAALSALSARQRACVVLFYYEDLAVAQIADILGCGEGSIKRHLNEARARLAASLSPSLTESQEGRS
jgi:RNA polymerase sigma-70 factor (sigma-E family)